MKKLLIGCLGIGAVCGLALGGAKLATQQSASELAGVVDQLNPLVKAQAYYVITEAPTAMGEHNTPIYEQTAADAQGRTRPLRFTGMKVFTTGKYLRIQSKGAHVTTYAAVPVTQVPAAARKALAR
ncbi:YxeA family protein [Lacticaseibacillus kribbianus]|uniref:YxeA family protein n=1 Tax=Lacticaseibacillus kribbianus TaxID=2926292 RepID=UPI001CD39162|nr:YxeA family protein [Lacticaseibacillus kribbianus]